MDKKKKITIIYKYDKIVFKSDFSKKETKDIFYKIFNWIEELDFEEHYRKIMSN